MNDRLTVFTKRLLDVMFFAGIAAEAAVPVLTHLYGAWDSSYAIFYFGITAVLLISGIMALIILFELRRMFATVIANDCFKRENVTSLRRMGNCSFVIAAAWCVRIFVHPTPSVLVIIAVFVIAGLFSKVLAGVFDRAVTYKLENDLTI